MSEMLVVDDELERDSALGQAIVDLVENELRWRCIFVKNSKEALDKINKNTMFAFLDIKFEEESPRIVKVLEKELKKQKIPYIILSNFDFPKQNINLSEAYSICNKIENKIKEELVKNELKKEQRFILMRWDASLIKIRELIEQYEDGNINKNSIIRTIKENKDLRKYFETDLEELKDIFTSKSFPEEVVSYPEKFYRVETIVKREFWHKQKYIKNIILSSTSPVPLTKSCTLLLFEESMSCCIKNGDDQVIGTFSLSSLSEKEKNAWEVLNKCKKAFPAPVEFSDKKTFRYAGIINEKTKDCTEGKIYHLVESVKGGSGKYKLVDINIGSPKTDKTSEKQNQYINRKEFETFKKEIFEKIENFIKIIPQQKLMVKKKKNKK